MVNKVKAFCGYFPDRIMDELNDKATIKCMHYILKKCMMSKSIDNISLYRDEVGGLSRKSFYNAIKKLESELWIVVDKSDIHKLKISLHPNYKYTPEELNHLVGR